MPPCKWSRSETNHNWRFLQRLDNRWNIIHGWTTKKSVRTKCANGTNHRWYKKRNYVRRHNYYYGDLNPSPLTPCGQVLYPLDHDAPQILQQIFLVGRKITAKSFWTIDELLKNPIRNTMKEPLSCNFVQNWMPRGSATNLFLFADFRSRIWICYNLTENQSWNIFFDDEQRFDIGL